MAEFEYSIIVIAVIASLIALLSYKWGYTVGKMKILTSLMSIISEEEEESNE